MSYIIVIKTQPHRGYQTYVGWDTLWPTRAAAKDSLAAAKKLWMAAKLVKVSE